MKNLTNAKDRHWLIKKDKQTGEIMMYIKHKSVILMQFPMPEEFLVSLSKLGYIEYVSSKSEN